MQNNLYSVLIDFIKNEKIKLKINKYSNDEFWIDGSDGSLVIRVVIDSNKHKIYYDVYSTENEEHLKVKTIKDIEQLVFINEENRKWGLVEDIEDLLLILDEIELWSQKNNFIIKSKILI